MFVHHQFIIDNITLRIEIFEDIILPLVLVWSVVLLGCQRCEHVERREPGGEGEERGEQRDGQRQQQRGLLEHGAHEAHHGGRAQHRRRHRQPRHDQPGQQQPLLLLQCTNVFIY